MPGEGKTPLPPKTPRKAARGAAPSGGPVPGPPAPPAAGAAEGKPRAGRGAAPAGPAACRCGSGGAAAGAAKRKGALHPCLDPESGLFREEHFALSLKYEMARSLEAEKPLGLLVISFAGGLPQGFTELLTERLRKIDLPARLGPGEAAVIMPRVSPTRAGRLVERLGEDLAGCGWPAGSEPRFGTALAWPNDSLTHEELLAKARASCDDAATMAERLLSGKGPFSEPETAIEAEEKDKLFAGFSELRGRKPER